MIALEFDANAKVGKNVLKEDPNDISTNGKFLLEFIDKQELVLTNAHKFCKGSITRQRRVGNKEERSILDYLIICKQMELFFDSLLIDEERKLTLFFDV